MADRRRWILPTVGWRTIATGETAPGVAFTAVAVTVALALAVVAGVPARVLGLAALSGAGLGLGLRWLAGDSVGGLVGGGLATTMAAVVGLASVGLLATAGRFTDPVTFRRVAAAGLLWTSGAGIGLGGTALLLGSLDAERVATATRRYLGAVVVLATLAGVATLVGRQVVPGATAAVDRAVGVVGTALRSTARPTAAAGPTVLLVAVGALLVRQATVTVMPPLAFADRRRERLQSVTDAVATTSGRTSVAALVVGGGLVAGDAAGVATTSTPGVAVLGGAPARGVALAVVGAGAVLGAGRAVLVARYRGGVRRLAGTTLPALGIVGGLACVGVAAVVRDVPVPQSVPAVDGVAGPVVLAAVVGGAALVCAGVLLGVLFLVTGLRPTSDPSRTILAAGLLGLPVVLAAVDGPAVVVVALVVPGLVATEAGAVGRSVASEVGRRAGVGPELVHGTATLGVGLVATVLAVGLVGSHRTVTLQPAGYLVGALAFVTALGLFGRLLSA